MSEERRRRQQEREAQGQPNKGTVRKVLVAVAIVAALGWGAYYYLRVHKRTSRLDTFARCLAAKQVKMYGLYWCTHCADQKEMFGSSFDYVTYVECGIKGQARGELESCKQAGIKNFPTWEFPNGERKEGALPLPVLSEKSGCSLP